jgi:hypothetical protein
MSLDHEYTKAIMDRNTPMQTFRDLFVKAKTQNNPTLADRIEETFGAKLFPEAGVTKASEAELELKAAFEKAIKNSATKGEFVRIQKQARHNHLTELCDRVSSHLSVTTFPRGRRPKTAQADIEEKVAEAPEELHEFAMAEEVNGEPDYIREAREAFFNLRKNGKDARDAWLLVGRWLAKGRDECVRKTGAHSLNSKYYRNAFSDWMKKFEWADPKVLDQRQRQSAI